MSLTKENVALWGLTGRALPSPIVDNQYGQVRTSRRGELVTSPLDRSVLADEGSYWVAHNPTNDASTTIAGHAAPVLADADATFTKPLVHCVNNAGSSSLIRCYLDFLEIEVVTAGANGTQACWACQLDTGTTRITSAGTALTVVNPNMQATNSGANLAPTAGAIVVGAESPNVRHLAHGTHRPSIEIAGDKYMFVFGCDPAATGGIQANAAAAVRNFVTCLPKVILGPTDYFMLALHGQASQSAAGVYKIRMGWSER